MEFECRGIGAMKEAKGGVTATLPNTCTGTSVVSAPGIFRWSFVDDFALVAVEKAATG